MDTPANNITGVTGAIAVTGWVSDDIDIQEVGIYRDPVGAESSAHPTGKIFIGRARVRRGCASRRRRALRTAVRLRGRLGLHAADQHAAEPGQRHLHAARLRDRHGRPHRPARLAHDHLRQRQCDEALRRDRHAGPGRHRLRHHLRELRLGADAACRTRFRPMARRSSSTSTACRSAGRSTTTPAPTSRRCSRDTRTPTARSATTSSTPRPSPTACTRSPGR